MSETLPAAPRGQTALATIKNPDTLRSLMRAHEPKFKALLPAGVTIEEVTAKATICCLRNPALWDCEPASMLLAVAEALSLGLKLDAISGEAYPVPFKGKITMIPGYRGLQNIAYQTGLVKAIEARAVYGADTFDWQEGTDPKLAHKPTLNDKPGEIIATYARATLTDGTVIFRVCPRREIEATMARSPAAQRGSSPWNTDFEAMACKTAVRRLFKALPTHPLLAAAENAELRGEGMAAGPLSEATAGFDFTSTVETTGQEVPPKETATGKLKGKLKGAKEAPSSPAAATQEPAEAPDTTPPPAVAPDEAPEPLATLLKRCQSYGEDADFTDSYFAICTEVFGAVGDAVYEPSKAQPREKLEAFDRACKEKLANK